MKKNETSFFSFSKKNDQCIVVIKQGKRVPASGKTIARFSIWSDSSTLPLLSSLTLYQCKIIIVTPWIDVGHALFM